MGMLISGASSGLPASTRALHIWILTELGSEDASC
jgi:hypothetical protein